MSYTIKDGRIADPGKFEGEPEWAPYFYEKGAEGFSDLDVTDENESGALWGFVVTEEDVEKYPTLRGVYAVTLEESDQGFVYAGEHTQEEYEELEREAS